MTIIVHEVNKQTWLHTRSILIIHSYDFSAFANQVKETKTTIYNYLLLHLIPDVAKMILPFWDEKLESIQVSELIEQERFNQNQLTIHRYYIGRRIDWRDKKMMENLVFRGRHHQALTILECNSLRDVPPSVKAGIDLVCFSPFILPTEQRLINKHFHIINLDNDRDLHALCKHTQADLNRSMLVFNHRTNEVCWCWTTKSF